MLSAGGHLLNSELLLETCDTDPLPLFRLVFSQLAVSCRALSQAIADDGKPEVSCHTIHMFPGVPRLCYWKPLVSLHRHGHIAT